MKTLALSFLTLTLLSACGQRGASPETGEKPGVTDEQASADAQVSGDEAQGSADESRREKEAAERAVTYRKALLGLIAGNSTTDCASADGASARGPITIDADGSVSAPGMKAHDLMGQNVTLSLDRGQAKAKSEAIGFLASDEKAGWHVSRQVTLDDKVTLVEDKAGLRCSPAAPTGTGAVTYLYPAVAKFFIAGSTTLQCNDDTDGVKSFKITPTRNAITIGNDSFALMRSGAAENVGIHPNEGTFVYGNDELMIQLDRSGKISTFTASGKDKTYLCLPPRA